MALKPRSSIMRAVRAFGAPGNRTPFSSRNSARSVWICGVVIVRSPFAAADSCRRPQYGVPATALGPCGPESAETASRFSRSSDRVLLEQSGDHGRVEVGANTYDQAVLEIDDPAVAIVETQAVLGRRQGMKLD